MGRGQKRRQHPPRQPRPPMERRRRPGGHQKRQHRRAHSRHERQPQARPDPRHRQQRPHGSSDSRSAPMAGSTPNAAFAVSQSPSPTGAITPSRTTASTEPRRSRPFPLIRCSAPPSPRRCGSSSSDDAHRRRMGGALHQMNRGRPLCAWCWRWFCRPWCARGSGAVGDRAGRLRHSARHRGGAAFAGALAGTYRPAGLWQSAAGAADRFAATALSLTLATGAAAALHGRLGAGGAGCCRRCLPRPMRRRRWGWPS